MNFSLKRSYFEGPLELLLSLIESKKMHISEISLAEVTEDYLNYINSLSQGDHNVHKMHDQSQFITVAGALILIKAKSLLPTLMLTDDEEDSIDDLTERLRMYEIIVRYGELLRKQITTSPYFFIGNPPKEKKEVVFSPHESLSSEVLITLLTELCATVPVNETLPKQSVKKTLSLADVMERVQQAVQSGVFHMRDITHRYHNATNQEEKREAKVFAVLSFLAVLEMVKKAQVFVQQQENFDDIVVTPYQDNQ